MYVTSTRVYEKVDGGNRRRTTVPSSSIIQVGRTRDTGAGQSNASSIENTRRQKEFDGDGATAATGACTTREAGGGGGGNKK